MLIANAVYSFEVQSAQSTKPSQNLACWVEKVKFSFQSVVGGTNCITLGFWVWSKWTDKLYDCERFYSIVLYCCLVSINDCVWHHMALVEGFCLLLHKVIQNFLCIAINQYMSIGIRLLHSLLVERLAFYKACPWPGACVFWVKSILRAVLFSFFF